MEVFVSPALKFEPITIMPISDIQSGVEACDLDLLAENIERGLKANAYFLGVGDYVDCASPSNRAAFKSAKLYDTIHSTMDEAVSDKIAELMEVLRPTRGKWLGLIQGHHQWDFQDGSSSDSRLAQELGTILLGDSAFIKLTFKDAKGSLDCVIWAHHGQGSGNTIGAPLNKLEKVIEWAEADLYLLGHMHKRVAANVPRFYIVGETLIAKERVVVCCGSYLKAYMQGSMSGSRPGGTYVEKAMLRPVTLGSPLIHIVPTRKIINGQVVCLNAFQTIT